MAGAGLLDAHFACLSVLGRAVYERGNIDSLPGGMLRNCKQRLSQELSRAGDVWLEVLSAAAAHSVCYIGHTHESCTCVGVKVKVWRFSCHFAGDEWLEGASSSSGGDDADDEDYGAKRRASGARAGARPGRRSSRARAAAAVPRSRVRHWVVLLGGGGGCLA